MENQYFISEQITVDPNTLSSTDGLKIITFNIEVLNKYTNNPDYEIQTSGNMGNVGLLKSKKQSWSLQIDVHNTHVNTWLYKLGALPEDEQAHFARQNIFSRELSQTAHNRWVLGRVE